MPAIKQIIVEDSNGKLFDLPRTQLNDAEQQGFAEVNPVDISDIPGQRNVVDPDGKRFSLPSTQVQEAKNQGYKLQSEIDFETGKSSKPRNTYEETSKKANDISKGFETVPENVHLEEGGLARAREIERKSAQIDMHFSKPRIEIINSKTGQIDNIPKEDVPKYMDQNPGSKFNDYSEEVAYYHAKKQSANSKIPNIIPAIGYGVLERVPFGTQIGNPSAGENLANRELANEHPIAKLGGNLAGTVAEVGLTGGAGLFGEFRTGAKLATSATRMLAGEAPSIARQGAAKIIGAGIEGATIMAPQAIAKATIDNDYKGAAESLLWGAGIGAGFGVVGLGANAVRKGFVSITERGETAALDSYLSSAGMGQTQIEQLSKPQKEGFVKSLMGMTEKETSVAIPTEEKISKNLAELSAGEKLAPSLEKLDAAIEKAGLPKIQMSEIINDIMTKTSSQDEKLALDFLRGKAENNQLTFTELQKVLSEAPNGITKDLIRDNLIKEIDSTVPKLNDLGLLNLKEIEKLTNDSVLSKTAAQLEQLFATATPQEKKGISKALIDIVGGKTGAIAGSVLGGGIPGMLIGGAVGSFSKKLLNSYLENSGSKVTGLLKKQSNAPALGSYIIIDAIHNAASKINQVPELIKAAQTSKQLAIKSDPIKAFLGSTTGLSKDQQFKEVSNRITSVASNPQLSQNNLQELLSPLREHHPELVGAAIQDYNNKIHYLNSILPKDPSPPKPFSKPTNWKPSAEQLDDFKKQLAIANDPLQLVRDFTSGKLTNKQVNTALTLNPEITAKIRAKISEEAYSGKVDLNYQQKLNLSVLMGESMHPSVSNIKSLQAVYIGQQPQQQPQPKKKSGHKDNSDKMLSAQLTPAQRQSR